MQDTLDPHMAIHIADNVMGTLEFLLPLLQRLGFDNVTVTEEIEDAWRRIKEEQMPGQVEQVGMAELIFLEWELGGPELLRTIRADPELEELAIIYVTDEQPSRRKGDRARRDGVSGWAVRGVTGPQLYHLMRDLVRQQRGE